MKAALLFDNFGPYHCARLRAANRLIPTTGIEFSLQSTEYPWLKGTSDGARILSLREDKSSSVFSHELSNALADINPDVVAIPGWSDKGAIIAAKWCLTHCKPVILMSESCREDSQRHRFKESVKSRFVSLCSSGLVGGLRHRDYLAQLGMPMDRIFMGYDAVDNDHFAPTGESPRAFTSPRQFLASARFITKKNLPALIQAYHEYRELPGGQPPWDLTILGDGIQRPQLEQLIQDLHLQKHVRLPGFIQYPELPSHYASASAFIHASTTEQWGLVVNEAMASGLPVLVSASCGCADDLVSNGINGFTFDPSSVPSIAEAMRKISRLEAVELNGMGEAGRRLIADRGLGGFADGFSSACRQALKHGPAKPSAAGKLLLTILSRLASN